MAIQCMASKVSEVVIDYVASLCACMSVKVLSDCMRLQSWMAEAICKGEVLSQLLFHV